jgi:hypothetical protein
MKLVWVNCIIWPSGRWTMTGVVAGWILVQGVLVISFKVMSSCTAVKDCRFTRGWRLRETIVTFKCSTSI